LVQAGVDAMFLAPGNAKIDGSGNPGRQEVEPVEIINPNGVTQLLTNRISSE